MRIEPNRSNLPIEAEQPDRAAEIASKTNPPTLDADYLEVASESPSIFQQGDADPVAQTSQEIKAKLEAAMQNGIDSETQELNSQPFSSGGGRPEAADESKSKSSGTIFDSPVWYMAPVVIEDPKKPVPENLRNLGMSESETDIIFFNEPSWRLRRFDENSGDFGAGYQNMQLNIANLRGRISFEAATPDKNGSLTGGIGAEAGFHVISVYYEAGYETPAVNIAGHDLNLKTEVDAEAEYGAKALLIAEASVGKDTYVHLGFSMFVGANAEVEVTESVGEYGEVHGGVGLFSGFGVSGSVYVGVEDGDFGVSVDDFGAALFFGATIDAGFSVDMAKLYELRDDTAGAGFELARNFWESRAEAAGEFANGAAETAKGVMEDIQEQIENFAEETVDTAEDAAEEAYETAEEVVEEAVDAATDAAEETAEDIEDAWNDFWD